MKFGFSAQCLLVLLSKLDICSPQGDRLFESINRELEYNWSQNFYVDSEEYLRREKENSDYEKSYDE